MPKHALEQLVHVPDFSLYDLGLLDGIAGITPQLPLYPDYRRGWIAGIEQEY